MNFHFPRKYSAYSTNQTYLLNIITIFADSLIFTLFVLFLTIHKMMRNCFRRMKQQICYIGYTFNVADVNSLYIFTELSLECHTGSFLFHIRNRSVFYWLEFRPDACHTDINKSIRSTFVKERALKHFHLSVATSECEIDADIPYGSPY